MAPELTQLAKPPAGEIVTDKVLESLMYGSSLAMAQGFGGTSNPTTIFDAMMRDTQFAFNYYRELEEKDEDAGGALEELKLAIISRDATVTPADDSTLAIEVSEFIQQQLSKIKNFDQALWALLDAPGHGVAIAETIFDVSMGQVSALEIKDRPQELFTFNPMSMPQNGPLRYLPNGTYDQSGGDLVPETKFLSLQLSAARRQPPRISAAPKDLLALLVQTPVAALLVALRREGTRHGGGEVSARRD
jgi:hypothetical protein